MIVIDPRAGSKNLIGLFPAEITVSFELPAADVMLCTEEGEVWTGIEHKKINDALACITTGRFAGTQLPAMHAAFKDYWLLIEGPFRESPRTSTLQVQSGNGAWYDAHVGNRFFSWSEYQKWKITLQTMTPLKIKETQSRTETRDWIMLLYSWWEKGSHRAHKKLDSSKDHAELVKASLRQRVAFELPGIGEEKAERVAAHFPTTLDMMLATEDEWVKIPGIGRPMAERIVRRIQNG